MPATPRRTLRRPARLHGPGLFSGQFTTLTLKPALPGSGLRFLRRCGEDSSVIPVHVDHVAPTPRRTCLRNGSLQVETVEHLLAALAGLGVTDSEMELESEGCGEIPMGDGSGAAFVEAIEEAGLEEAGEPVEPLIVREPVLVGTGESSLAALPGPADALEIVYTFEAPPPVGRQVYTFRLQTSSPDDFRTDLAPARTFLFAHEAEQMKASGMGGHLTYADLVVIGDSGPIDNAFRFPDECVRHKVLDLIGDLALVGRPVYGRIIGQRGSHALNHELARKLLETHPPGGQPADPPEPAPVRSQPVASGKPESPESAAWRHLLGRSATDAALDVRKIQRILPHRFPMLLVDRVLEIDRDQRAVGIKNVTMGDVFFLGHYPGTPIFPGVLIVEAMGQMGGILLSRKLEHTGKLAVLLSMDGVKMRHPVVPGDQLVLVAEAVRVRTRTGHVRCRAYVGERVAAEAEIKFMLVDAEPA